MFLLSVGGLLRFQMKVLVQLHCTTLGTFRPIQSIPKRDLTWTSRLLPRCGDRPSIVTESSAQIVNR